MNRKLVTTLELVAIVGLMLLVLWLSGIFKTEPVPSPSPLPSSPSGPTRTPSQNGLTATPARAVTQFPTNTSPPAQPTPTFPPLTKPSGLVAFDTTRDGNSEIYVMAADGSNQRNLTNNAADDAWPSWSPDGKQIAFLSTRSGWPELYVMAADGSNVRQLSNLAKTSWAYQAPIRWSPDGRQILIMASRLWTSHIYVRPRLDLIQADGTGMKTAFQEETTYVWEFSWVPESQYVLLDVIDDAHGTCALRLFTRVIIQYQLLYSLCQEFAPSPDGTQLAISNGSINLYALGDLTPLKLNGTANAAGQLSWSPNGRYIVYLTNSGPYYRAAYTDGSGALPFALSFNRNELSWSPDSQWLAYNNVESDGNSDISIINLFDSTHPLQLTDTGNNYAPVWQPIP